MNEEHIEADSREKSYTRHFILSIICVAIGTYTSVLIISFSIALIFKKWVAQTLTDFFEDRSLPPNIILWLALSGLIINLVSFYGVLRMWRLKKWGYYIYVASSLIFVLFPFILGFGNIYSVIIVLSVIGLLTFFIKRFN